MKVYTTLMKVYTTLMKVYTTLMKLRSLPETTRSCGFQVYIHTKEYILVIERSTPLSLPKMCLTQPLPALSSIHRVHLSNYLTV